MEIEMIELGLLLDHPLNANVMGVEQMLKLRRQISGSGRYEPLVVRRHPQEEGCYELLNGHHRRRVLAQLGYERASCVVWEVSDEEALQLLATLNRLCGQDDPRLRGRLLEELGRTMEVEQLRKVLPESEEKLRKLLSLKEGPVVAAAGSVGVLPEAMTFFVTADEKGVIVEGLKTIRDSMNGKMGDRKLSRGTVLAAMAKNILDRINPP